MKLAPIIVNRAKTLSIASRSVVVSNDKLLKQTEKIKLASRSDASLFATSLLLIRRKYKHRGVELIKPGTTQWGEIKELCKLATEFCNEFSLALKQGYIEYCEIGLRLMKSFYLSKFKVIHQGICQYYEAEAKIKSDKWQATTELVYHYYLKKVNERVGFCANNYKDDPTKYVCFVNVVQQAREIGVDVKIYIDAQFAGLEWANAIPDPCQLVSSKSTERLMKYCSENSIKVGKKERTVRIDYTKIKRNGKNHT